MKLIIKYPVEECYVESAYMLKKNNLNEKECFQSIIMSHMHSRERYRNENTIQFKYRGRPYSVPSEWLEDIKQDEFVVTGESIREYLKTKQHA